MLFHQYILSKLGCRSSLLLLVFLVFSTALHAAETIRFAPFPNPSAQAQQRNFHTFSETLARITGQPVGLTSEKSYATLLDNLLADRIDLACLDALPYALLSLQKQEFVPVVRFANADGSLFETCSLASFAGEVPSVLSSPKAEVVLPEPYSLCSYLLTEQALNRRQLSLRDRPYYYAGSSVQAALDVILGKAAVAGLETSVARQYRHLGLRVLESEIPLPGKLLVANPRTLSPDTISLLKAQLLELSPRIEQQGQISGVLWAEEFSHGMVAANREDYRVLEKLLGQIHIPEAGE